MVQSNIFTLRLVDAFTKTDLNERVDSNGRTWVKGDGGDEFFVVVENLKDPMSSIKCCISVDGVDLGYTWISHCINKSTPLGPMKSGQTFASGNDLTAHAFRFVRHERTKDEVKDETTRETKNEERDRHIPESGTVTAVWYVATNMGNSIESHRTTDWTGQTNSKTSSHKKDQSTLHATVGSVPATLPMKNSWDYDTGRELARATIHYTTDFGMAVRGLYSTDEVTDDTPVPKRVKKEELKKDGETAEAAIVLE